MARQRDRRSALRADLLTQYGRPRLVAALDDLMIDSPEHHIPPAIAARIAPHALLMPPCCSTAPAAKAAPPAPSSRRSAPDLKVFVTVDNGAARYRRRRVHPARRCRGRHRRATLRHHRQIARRLALPADLPRRARSRHRRHLQPQSLGRVLSRRPHRHRHHRHQGQVDHRDPDPSDAHLRRPRRRPRRQCRPRPARNRRQAPASSSSSSRATRPPTWRSRPISRRSPTSPPSTPTGTATSTRYYADKLNLIDRDAPFPVGPRPAGADQPAGPRGAARHAPHAATARPLHRRSASSRR